MTAVPEHDEILPLELALGLLDEHDEALALARLADDAAFADAVARWRETFADGLAPPSDAPRPSLWVRVADRVPANDDRQLPSPASRWKWATAAASVLVVAFGIYSLRPQPTRVVVRQVAVERVEPQPTLAVLTGSTGHAAVAISIDQPSGRVNLAPVELHLGGKVPELWVIPTGGVPRALGVVSAQLNGAIRPPRDVLALITPGATLAISEEPPGGSPTGLPTGRVILTGKVA